MIERHITFNVHPDRTTDFERFFAERYRPAMSPVHQALRPALATLFSSNEIQGYEGSA